MKNLVYKIIGSAMEVHKELGWGLLEKIYQEALQIELQSQGITAEREVFLNTYYKGQQLKKTYALDMLVNNQIVIECKADTALHTEHRAQLCNYLRLTKLPLGILINFGTPTLQCERWLHNPATNTCVLADRDLHPVPRKSTSPV